MKKFAFLMGFSLSAVLLFSGCGDSDQTSSQGALGSSTFPTGLSGQIIDEGGQAQAGGRVIANERTSDAKVEGVSGSDGRFQLSLPAGVYDVGIDRAGDSSTATCFYGPVSVASFTNQDLILRSARGRAAHEVWGQLYLTPGVPAASRKINLRSGHFADPEAPEAVSGVTSGQGSFSLLLSSEQELGLDLEVFNGAGQFDEFIDIGKLSKPCYLEFSTELPVAANRLRSDQADIDSEVVQAQASPPDGFQLFNHLESKPDPMGGPAELLLTQGLLPVSSYTYQIFDGIMTPAIQQQFDTYRGLVASGPLRVDKNGSWWWTYAVNIKPDQKSYWQFEDQTGDDYSLSVYITSYWHKVSYNSSKPEIQGVATLDPTQN